MRGPLLDTKQWKDNEYSEVRIPIVINDRCMLAIVDSGATESMIAKKLDVEENCGKLSRN